MSRIKGREREAEIIRQANRAAAVGSLMLGKCQNWVDFLKADTLDLENLPRRQLKSGRADVEKRLSPEIKNFCQKNFQGMDKRKLSQMYEDIKAHRGLEMPLSEFEERFAPVQRKILAGNPIHLTISISLWGFQLMFPEDELAKDIIEAFSLASEAQNSLEKYKKIPQPDLERNRDEIGFIMRKRYFAVRSTILSCFNLIEAYLNGLAWDFLKTHSATGLSKRNMELLKNSASTSIRNKLLKYPEIITGKSLWKQPDLEFDGFVDITKPFRDSLVHPSPFTAPEKFGGYDKLRLFYRIDFDTAEMTLNLLIKLIDRIHKHIHGDQQTVPVWLEKLISKTGILEL